jgi:hypothetical protein
MFSDDLGSEMFLQELWVVGCGSCRRCILIPFVDIFLYNVFYMMSGDVLT